MTPADSVELPVTQADVTEADKAAVTRFHATQIKRIMAGDKTLGEDRNTIEQAFAERRLAGIREGRLSAESAHAEGWRGREAVEDALAEAAEPYLQYLAKHLRSGAMPMTDDGKFIGWGTWLARRQIDAILALFRSPSASDGMVRVPDGYRILPIEPTAAMIAASGNTEIRARDDWRRMLSRAPSPEEIAATSEESSNVG